MNLFGCLFPCALQHSWWGGESGCGGTGGDNSGGGGCGGGGGDDHHHHHHHHDHDQCMSDDEFVRRMGVNASTVASGGGTSDATGGGNTISIDPTAMMPGYRDTIPNSTGGSDHQSAAQAPPQRKKKVTGFATLKKKFIRRRRSSKACDHGRMLRDLVSNWSPLELSALLEEYEALAALKDLCVQAELARPPAATFKQDLSALYDFKYCTDADLVYRGACFPIHRALLSVRCPYFRDLLVGCPGYGARICLELRTATVDVALFSALLRYLYTGDICPHDGTIDLTVLRRLRDEFGTPNALENDLRYLLESGDYADAALVFTSDGSGGDCQRPDSGSSEYGFRPKLELPCHKAILSARSHFFRNLLQRRCRSGEEHTERALHIPTRIVLDESVIPKRYAKVLLHAVYLDQVDLSLIARGGCGGGLGEAQALAHTGRARPSPLEEAMELYQIGRFLELDILSQGCEDLILDCLSVDTLPAVLQWARQPYGSAWVHRQAIHFLREEFQPIAQSVILHQLDKIHLSEVLKSPFLQASELEILHAVLKWGENELVRRMEDREPNILCHTAHSVARKGVKKRDLSDVELREILAELLPLVRIEHILPVNSDALAQAVRRGLVNTPPPSCLLDHQTGGGTTHRSGAVTTQQVATENVRASHAWIRGGGKHSAVGGGGAAGGLFVQPRLFMPYYEELKVLLEDQQLVQEVEIMRMRRTRYQDIPDTLYMLDDTRRDPSSSHLHHHHLPNVTNPHHHHHHHHHHLPSSVGNLSGGNTNTSHTTSAGGPAGVDILAAASSAASAVLPVPEAHIMAAMLMREAKLRQSPSCQRSLQMPLSVRHEINRQIRLRVVREFNLPDPVADMLEGCYCVATTTGSVGSINNNNNTGATGGAGVQQGVISGSVSDQHNSSDGELSSCGMIGGSAGGSVISGGGLVDCISKRGGNGVSGGDTASLIGGSMTRGSHTTRNMTFPRPVTAPHNYNTTGTGQSQSSYHRHHHHHHHHHRTINDLPAIVADGNLVSSGGIDCRYPPVNSVVSHSHHLLLSGGEPESSSCSDGHLSDIMPDVAMATAGLSQLQLQLQQEQVVQQPHGLVVEQQQLHGGVQQQQLLLLQQREPEQQLGAPMEMELDLGDGAAHLHSGGTMTTTTATTTTTAQQQLGQPGNGAGCMTLGMHHPMSYRRYGGGSSSVAVAYSQQQQQQQQLHHQQQQQPPPQHHRPASQQSYHAPLPPRFL